MKILKLILLIVISIVSTLTMTAASLSKGGVSSSGEFSLETFKYLLRNRNIPRKSWYIVPTTGQNVFIFANMNNYANHLSSNDIDGLIVLDARDVKSGSYRNNGYDAQGNKVPIQEQYLPIVQGYKYFCKADSAPVAKTNCINEQDVYANNYVNNVEAPFMMYVPCWNIQIEMEKTLIDGVGRWSKDHSIYFENNKWYTANSDGSVSELNCTTPAVAQVQTKVVYVQQQCCQQVQQPVVYTQANSCGCPATMGRAYSYQPAPAYPQPVSVTTRSTNISFGLILSPGGGYQRYPVYMNQPQTQFQPQYGTPSVFQSGTPFDTGSQGYYPVQTGGSFDTGTYPVQTGGAPYTGQGYIPGVAERVQ